MRLNKEEYARLSTRAEGDRLRQSKFLVLFGLFAKVIGLDPAFIAINTACASVAVDLAIVLWRAHTACSTTVALFR